MTKKSADPKLSGAQLTAVTAEKVFGWKNVQRQDGGLTGKKQDKLGRWRSAKVPDYANDPVQAYAIDQRMKETGRWDAYMKELSRAAKAKQLPREWATPAQRCRAAIIALRSKRN